MYHIKLFLEILTRLTVYNTLIYMVFFRSYNSTPTITEQPLKMLK